ncbi:MAG: helix-turn-helix domain-containing protein, partial [Campylobacter sp.]|nr:helix-turn-helix domain-containing protein [Campylobacter sp.]
DNIILIKNANKIKLTKNEIALLKLLVSGKKRIVTSYEIENELFDDDLCENKRVRDIVSRFHKKIDYKLIENIYSQGYRIKWQ